MQTKDFGSRREWQVVCIVDGSSQLEKVAALWCIGSSMVEPMVCTIGHSNRSIEDFIGLLWLNEVEIVVDVRTIPRSRHNPQFNLDTLPASLTCAGIGYIHMPGLGGLRHAQAESPNTGWHNASFRGYADYMQSTDFAENVEQVVKLADSRRCALMCAEAVPWRCHRSMIADALLIRGVRVEDIIGEQRRKLHVLTSFAHVNGLHLTYPPLVTRTGADYGLARP